MNSGMILGTVTALLLLAGCTTGPSHPQQAANFIQRQHVVNTTAQHYPAKTNPQSVAIFHKDQKPSTPYRVIGTATVSKYNLIGVAREEQIMHEMMKNLAASIGGDGIINISTNNDSIQANVIRFQKILI